MSVTIVSALPSTSPTPQAGGIESMAGSEDGAISLGFADILLGKKLTSLAAETGEPALSEESENGLVQAGSGEVDAASILAALGLAIQQPANIPKEQATVSGGTGQATDATISLAPAGTGIEKSLQPESTPQTAPLVPAAATAISDTPAKFAAVAASVAETPLTAEPSATSEAPDKAISALVAHPTTTVQREAPLSVQTHVRDQSWSSDFAQKIVWLVNNDKQSAQLTLNPPQMGPIEISLSVDKGNASAAFVSANPEVRDAIETALPRLREMFASAGIQLGQTNVSSESFRQQAESNSGNPAASQGKGDNAILAGVSGESATARAFLGRAANGLVDLFA